MKKFALTILAIVYITVSSGATVHLHYCMDKLTGWGFTNKSPDKCGNCGMAKQEHKGCCHDEHKVIKASQDHKISESSFSFKDIPALKEEFNIEGHTSYLPFTVSFNPNNHAPPGVQVATYIYICVFKI